MNNNALLALLALVVLGGIFLTYRGVEVGDPALRTVHFESQDFGVAFEYPSIYEPELREEGTAERSWQTVVLMPQDYVAPEAGEGPPTIAIAKYPNGEGLSLYQWIQSDARSNFKLSSDQSLEETSVANTPAFKYQYSGLYESDAVVVAIGTDVYVFSVSYAIPQDPIREQFQDMFSTVRFLR